MERLEDRAAWKEIQSLLRTNTPIKDIAVRFKVKPSAIVMAMMRTETAKGSPREEEVSPVRVHPGESAAGRGPAHGKEDFLPPEKEAPMATRRGLATNIGGSKSHQIERHRDKLGIIPDAEVARLAGCSTRTVAAYRARHGIPGYDRWADPRQRAPRSARRSKIDPYHDLVGIVPDNIIAQKAGVSPQAVRNYRSKRRIPAPSRARPAQREEGMRKLAEMEGEVVTPRPAAREEAPKPAPRAAPPAPARPAPAPAARREEFPLVVGEPVYAWRLTFQRGEEQVTRIAIGTPADVAQKGERSGLGPLVHLERLEVGLG